MFCGHVNDGCFRVFGPAQKVASTLMNLPSLRALMDQLGHGFRAPELLRLALTHKSYRHELEQKRAVVDELARGVGQASDNERLEFLGDAILSAVLAELLYRAHPQACEGELSQRRSALVNETVLAELAQELNLGPYLLLGKGERQSGGELKASILSGALEGVIAALYLDGGSGAVRCLLERLYSCRILQKSAHFGDDSKSQLQEWVQANYRSIPEYRLDEITGPAHARSFKVEVWVAGKCLGSAAGLSKKKAEQAAATVALTGLAAFDSAVSLPQG